ncbi:PEGA domain-containing protein [Patescibacteria group bacterium]|nr:PEGA domain-containing protein [Patescibacteria group bacterium]
MRQRIYTPPFHRRILPWIFIVIFFAIAPVLLFYTSGYRWSSPKGQIERNGTIILDSTPTKATLTIDGRIIQDVTPITLQDMAPGLHRFRLDKAGYHSWEKSLEITSERVTFANDLWLWRQSEPTLLTTTAPLILSSSVDGRQTLAMSQATSSLALLLTTPDQISSSSTLAVRVNATTQLNWSPNGRYVIAQTVEGTSTTRWIIDTRNTNAPLTIPDGSFRWDADALVIQNALSQTRIQLSDFSLRRVPFTSHVVDTSAQATIRSNEATNGLVFVEAQNINQGIELPAGTWHLWSSTNGMHIIRDGNRWMSIQLNEKNASTYEAVGDQLRSFTSGGITQYLLVNHNELWIWNPTTQPELVYRQSERIVDAAWHSENGNIFFATHTGIFALNLDQRDGRIVTQLATFDEITGFSTLSNQLVIAGTKNAQTGIWTLAVE